MSFEANNQIFFFSLGTINQLARVFIVKTIQTGNTSTQLAAASL